MIGSKVPACSPKASMGVAFFLNSSFPSARYVFFCYKLNAPVTPKVKRNIANAGFQRLFTLTKYSLKLTSKASLEVAPDAEELFVF